MKGDEAERVLGFDEWVAGRAGALTRFAYLLTGSELAAERALADALAVACATWSRVRRSDDPEAQVQQLLVQAYLSPGAPFRRQRPTVAVPSATAPAAPSSRFLDDATLAWRVCAAFPAVQRAALVLRCHAEKTYPQIAAMLQAKEAVVSQDVDRGFAALSVAIGEPRSEVALEAAFGEAFGAHADDPSNAPDVTDLVARARAGAARSRRRVVAGVAAGALIVAGLAAIGLTHDSGSSPAAKPPFAGTNLSPPFAGIHPSGWRAESYNGVQLWVPSSWGWGEVPHRSGESFVSCGFGAYSMTAITTNLRFVRTGAGQAPYVGRPVAVSANCTPMRPVDNAHVWFDSPLPLGTDAAQTTVRVTGLSAFNVTVADANAHERNTILRSIQQVPVDANGCPRGPADFPRLRPAAVAELSPSLVRSLSVCLFARADAGEEGLFYSTRVDGIAARHAAEAFEASVGAVTADVCLVTPALEHAAIIARGTRAFTVFGVNTDMCVDRSDAASNSVRTHMLSDDSVRVWAANGLAIYASIGPDDTRLIPQLPAQ